MRRGERERINLPSFILLPRSCTKNVQLGIGVMTNPFKHRFSVVGICARVCGYSEVMKLDSEDDQYTLHNGS
jgi:hypothetical protein